MLKCPGCGEENPPKFRLCGYCGTALTAAAAPLPAREMRKTVTIVFCDLKGSTALGEQLDAEALHEVKARYFAAMAAEITRHGGKIEKYIGDAIMAVFGLPRAHEDDALRAVRAALGMQAGAAPRQRGPDGALRLRAGQPHRRQHRRGGGQRRPGGRPEARHRRCGQRRGAPGAGRAGKPDLPRRRDLPAGPRRGRGRGCRAARTQRQGAARGGVPPGRGAGAGRPGAPPRPAAGRPRRRTGDAGRAVRRGACASAARVWSR